VVSPSKELANLVYSRESVLFLFHFCVDILVNYLDSFALLLVSLFSTLVDCQYFLLFTFTNMNDELDINGIHKQNSNLKVPEFNAHDLELWLSQLELHFTISGITGQRIKFAYLSSHLPPSVIVNPPEGKQYDALKTALLSRTSRSDESKVKQLLEDIQLGDRKPSQLLRHMQQLAGSTAADPILRQLWIQRLPSGLQPLASELLTRSSLGKVGEAADKAMDQIHPSIRHAATPQPSTSQVGSQDLMMTQLCQSLAAIATDLRESRARSRPRERS
jgi:hypothetical protein